MINVDDPDLGYKLSILQCPEHFNENDFETAKSFIEDYYVHRIGRVKLYALHGENAHNLHEEITWIILNL